MPVSGKGDRWPSRIFILITIAVLCATLMQMYWLLSSDMGTFEADGSLYVSHSSLMQMALGILMYAPQAGIAILCWVAAYAFLSYRGARIVQKSTHPYILAVIAPFTILIISLVILVILWMLGI